jgi:hypothetical protein
MWKITLVLGKENKSGFYKLTKEMKLFVANVTIYLG